VRTGAIDRRVARLERGRSPAGALCQCAAQLEAIGRAEVLIDAGGRCLFCSQPVTLRWSQFGESLQLAYGGVEHDS
jgi:hypothetical protein